MQALQRRLPGAWPRRHGVALLDGFDHPAADDRDTYAADGFHPSAGGAPPRRGGLPAGAALPRSGLTEAPA